MTSSDTHIKIPFPQNESDFPLWASQIQDTLKPQNLLDCITTACPDDPAAFTTPIPTPAATASTATATEIQAIEAAFVARMSFYQATLTAHNAALTQVRRWAAIIRSNLGRTQLVLVRSVPLGDARALWTALQNAYGNVRNVNTLTSLYSSLSTITKLDSRSINERLYWSSSIYDR